MTVQQQIMVTVQGATDHGDYRVLQIMVTIQGAIYGDCVQCATDHGDCTGCYRSW